MGTRTSRVAGALAVALLAPLFATPATPARAADVDNYWKVDVWGHPVEPYAQIPEELDAGSPGSWVQLAGKLPVQCEAKGILIDTGGSGETGDQLAYELADHNYENPTKAAAANPETRRATKDDKVTFPNGPEAKAECASPTSGAGTATWGRYLSKDFSFESASSDSTETKSSDEGSIVTETTNKIQGIKMGPLSIGTVFSWLKVEFRESAEPVISYKIDISGITDGQSQTGAGYPGVARAGQGLLGRDLTSQFNSQVKSGQSGFKPLGKYGLRILEPRIGYSRSQRYVVEISALDGLFGLAARQNQIGDGFGMRLGVSRAAGRYELNGKPAPHNGYEYLDDPTFGFY
ncbi:MAG TPA: hypothetical protein VHL53_20450 [Acidimicrobiia bacterium]|nr:hypothetical protein [Acidimicrobiia bacterium]